MPLQHWDPRRDQMRGGQPGCALQYRQHWPGARCGVPPPSPATRQQGEWGAARHSHTAPWIMASVGRKVGASGTSLPTSSVPDGTSFSSPRPGGTGALLRPWGTQRGLTSPSPSPHLTPAAAELQPGPCQLQGQGSVGALVGTCQPQLQRLVVPLEGIQLRAEVEGTLRREEAELPPAMGYPPCTPTTTQLTSRSWARSLSTSSGPSGCATVNAGTPGCEGWGCSGSWGCSGPRGSTP